LNVAKIWSASLVQVNGWQRWFQPSQNRPIATTQRLALDDRKEHLDQVPPRGVGRREV
jgi:hypothetical protein